ncbi:hypothetical protein TNCV_2925851 [Trichonephila clavipes]|nr:hypothetical protein TNCV_2925851 [Trichonephila clavipes]
MSARHHLKDYDRERAVGRLEAVSTCHHYSCGNGCIKECHLAIKEVKKFPVGGNALRKHAFKDRYVALVTKGNRNFISGQIAANLATITGTHVSARNISLRLNQAGLCAWKTARCIPLQSRHL